MPCSKARTFFEETVLEKHIKGDFTTIKDLSSVRFLFWVYKIQSLSVYHQPPY